MNSSVQPHLSGGFVSSPIVACWGVLVGATAGYFFPYIVAANRTQWRTGFAFAVRIGSAVLLAIFGAVVGYNEDLSILYSSGLGYVAGLAAGCLLMLIRDDFWALGASELSLGMFMGVWGPALLGAFFGSVYNELMHGSSFLLGTAKMTLMSSACSVATFALMFIVQAIDAALFGRRPLL